MALELLICYDGKEELTDGDVRQRIKTYVRMQGLEKTIMC